MAKRPTSLPGKLLAALGSYWLAVACLVNLFLLTWLGTLEQVEKGIHQVQDQYFESWYVFARAGRLKLLLPGGYLTMGLFTVNLLVGGLVRIRKTRRTAGVIVAHVGIALMMVGGLVEHATSTYGRIVLNEGQTGDQFEEYAGWELAIWDAAQRTGVLEYTIPEEDFDDLTRDGRRRFHRDELPFDLVVSRFFRHCQPRKAVGSGIPTAPVIEDYFLEALPRLKEEAGEFRGVYVAAVSDGGSTVKETFLWGRRPIPWAVEAGGRTWGVVLRRKTHSLPFAIRLDDFEKDDHPGTAMARSYSSDVTKVFPDGSTEKEHIRMNEPLRDAGLVIYQSGYGPQEGETGPPYSVLAVSRNPSDRVPWYAVSIIAIGLAWTMLDRLMDFVNKERARRERGRTARIDDLDEAPPERGGSAA